MRLLILSLVLANAALMSAADVAAAQSPTSYPWCSRSPDRTSNINCYFRADPAAATDLYTKQCSLTFDLSGGRGVSPGGMPTIQRTGRAG
jgi:hypothetical protein